MDERGCFFYISNLILAPLSIFGLYKRISTTLQSLSSVSLSCFSHPLLSVLHHSAVITLLSITPPLCLCLSAGLRGSCADPAIGKWRRNHSCCFSHTEHLCISHADPHPFTPSPSSPPVSSNPHLLLPKRCRSHCSDAHRSSPWYPSTCSWPKPRQCFPWHPLCRASSGEEAFPSAWAQASLDRVVWGQCIPQCLLPIRGHVIPRLPGQWDVEPKQRYERRLPVPQCVGAFIAQTTQSHRHGVDLRRRYLVTTYTEWVIIEIGYMWLILLVQQIADSKPLR